MAIIGHRSGRCGL